ncbi:Bcd1p CYBJADRAFT_124687, partial [Cyberlindnera jadinii NRRL Y-1542]
MEEGNYCEICLENEAKYRCPQCGRRTCSVACVRAHKEQSQCSGTVDNTSFVKRSEFLENSHLIQRDYNFLTNLDRALSVKRQDSRQNRALKRQRTNGNAQGNHQQVQMKRGVRVKYLPKGMQRSNQNKSSWDKKKETYVWTVEFQL